MNLKQISTQIFTALCVNPPGSDIKIHITPIVSHQFERDMHPFMA